MLKDWVRKARATSKLTQEEFGQALGVTKANISAWENGRHEPSFQQMLKISEISGEPLPGASNVAPASIGTRRIPIIDYVQAGMWTGMCEERSEFEPTEFVSIDLAVSNRAFALWVKGDSMLPVFAEGDCIIVDPDVAPRPGDFVVASNCDEEAIFKQYRLRGLNERGNEVFELTPLNPVYPSIRSDQVSIRIVGTVVKHERYLRGCPKTRAQ